MQHKGLAFSFGGLMVLALVFMSLWVVVGFSHATRAHELGIVAPQPAASVSPTPATPPEPDNSISDEPPDLSGEHQVLTSGSPQQAFTVLV